MANELNFVVKNGLTVDTDTLYVDHTTDRVGIGTNILGTNKLSIVDTWNSGVTTFTGIKFDVTDTASDAASLLLDLQVGSSTQFSVDKNGNIVVGGTLNTHTIPGGTGTLALTSDITWTVSDGSITQDIVSGDTLTVTGGTDLTSTVSATDTLTIDHDNISRSDTTSNASPGYGATFDVVDSVTSSATGHVTAINVKTVTLPASDDTTGINIVGASSAAVTDAAATNGNVWLNHIEDNTVVSNHNIIGSGATTVTSDANGDITISSTNQATTFTLTADSGTNQTIAHGNTLDIAGGTYIATVVGATDTVTINHDSTTRSDTTSVASPAYGATFDVVDSVTTNATGHLTAVNVKTVTIPASDNTDTLQDINTDATDADQYITFVPNTSGAQTGRVDAGLVYNPSSNNLTVSGNVTVGGDLIVNGTTTTVNSTTVTIDDPIFTLGGDTAPATDDNKDRGIEFRWHNGTSAKVGFFGFDDSTGKFTFIPDATNTSEVFSGTTGEIDAKLDYSNLLNVPADANTTYDLTIPVGTTDIRLAGSDATNDDITITGGSNVTVTRTSATELTIEASASANTTYTISTEPGGDGSSEIIRLTGNDATTDDITLAVAQTGTTDGLTISESGDTITFAHADTSTLSGAQGSAGIASITVDEMGHVTAVSTATYLTSESDDFGTVTVTDTDSGFTWAETGSAVAETAGDTLTLVSGANVDIDVDAANDAIRISATNTNQLTTFTLTADSGTNQTIAHNDTLDIAGGTYISTVVGATDTVTINHDSTTRSDTTSSASPAHGATFDVVDSVTTNATGHLTAINVKTVTLPADNNSNNFGTLTVTDTDSGFTWAETGSIVADSATDTATFVSGTNVDIDVDATSDAIRIQTTTNQYILDNHTIVSNTQTTTATTQVALDTFSDTSYAGAEVVVTAIQGTSRHIIKMLITHDGTDTYETQFGEIITGSSLFTLTSDINTGNVRILCTPASTTSTKFNTYVTRIEN